MNPIRTVVDQYGDLRLVKVTIKEIARWAVMGTHRAILCFDEFGARELFTKIREHMEGPSAA